MLASKKDYNHKAWLVSVDMGYGHQRTAYPLRFLAQKGEVINANNYTGIPKKDRNVWENSRKFYEFISRFKRIPLIGQAVFHTFNHFQKIFKFYPKRDLSKPNFLLKTNIFLIEGGWGKHLIQELAKEELPLVTSFYITAFMAEAFNYPGEIFCIVCDADMSRTWVSLKPRHSRIKYFAPTKRVVERLKLYGVKPENIFYTGYPLPLENLGTEKNLEILKNDLSHRLLNLDPKASYRKQYNVLIKEYLGSLPNKSNHPLTIMFAIGGAGAQKTMAIEVVKNLANKIKDKEVRIILVAGIKKNVREYFIQEIQNLGLTEYLGTGIEIIFKKYTEAYFEEFNKALRTTDILWTKPSELSFYTALGLPIIIAPPIGSQEDFNQEWLFKLGSGINQKNPKYTNQWLFDLLEAGWFAEAAMDGFIEAEKLGTYNIQSCLLGVSRKGIFK